MEVVTTTSEKYETIFGFTEKEVFHALDEYGLSDQKREVKEWYDGFQFGNTANIYNSWSIINFLRKKKLDADLLAKDFREDRIIHYGFVFEGKKVLFGAE